MAIDIHTPLLVFRRAKIVATVGPASSNPAVIRALIEAGTNVFRLNMSHGDHATHRKVHGSIREMARGLDVPVAILADLAGPKIRTGRFEGGGIDLESGDQVVVTTKEVRGKPGLIPSQYPGLVNDVRPGQRILLSDGLIALQVNAVEGDEIHCTVLDGGRLGDRKGINLPDSEVSAPSLTEKDEADAAFALDLGVDYLALSFVRRAEDVRALKRLIEGHEKEGAAVVAKIERPEALQHADEIVRESDAIMVARGDLGVEVPQELVPMAQQKLIDLARRHQRPVIVATQMLESMIENARPTRAEVSDVATAVNDGADAVMLSGETAVGEYPVAAVRMMDRITRQTEAQLWHRNQFESLRLAPSGPPPYEFPDALASATAALSRDLRVRAVVASSTSGLSVVTMASARPAAPIIVLSSEEATRRRMSLAWGVVAVFPCDDDVVEQARRVTRALDLAEPGQTILLVRGFSADPATNLPSVTLIHV